MKYFLVLFLFGILCRNTLARRLDNPVFYDLERRLVRLEASQFTENENLEHRMLQLERQLGTQQKEESLESQEGDKMLDGSTVDPNFYETVKVEKTSEGITFLQRLEKLEKRWEKELEEQLAKFSSKYDSLSERFSAIEKHLEEEQTKAVYNQLMESLTKEPEKPESAEGKSDDPESNEHIDDEIVEESDESEPENVESKKESPKEFQKIGTKLYYIENIVKESWIPAIRKCRELNAHLVSLQDEEEWSALKEAFEPNHSYWVDINDRVDEDRFISHTTGKLAPFLKWDDNEPNSAPGAEDCVELRVDHDYKMNDVSCEEEKYYICELSTNIEY